MSSFGDQEKEILLPPYCAFEVRGNMNMGNGLRVISLHEIVSPAPLLDSQRDSQPSTATAATHNAKPKPTQPKEDQPNPTVPPPTLHARERQQWPPPQGLQKETLPPTGKALPCTHVTKFAASASCQSLGTFKQLVTSQGWKIQATVEGRNVWTAEFVNVSSNAEQSEFHPTAPGPRKLFYNPKSNCWSELLNTGDRNLLFKWEARKEANPRTPMYWAFATTKGSWALVGLDVSGILHVIVQGFYSWEDYMHPVKPGLWNSLSSERSFSYNKKSACFYETFKGIQTRWNAEGAAPRP
eukprot:TRINITY_DN49062_c0_g1_i1.p2 TRINITY_DN49062_c0_g1~~TRINITY_DN49062_c0_g1_i1.p2  ORF type:complete len:337 (+),score=23.77 TRINITY_DN49062_c0_g1_i1:122-1012(+)